MTNSNPLLSLFKEQLENESRALASENELTKRGDLLIWWYFSKLRGLDSTAIGQIICDGGGDLGIDGIFVDEEDFVHFYSFKNPENSDDSFPGRSVDAVIGGLTLILERRYETVANPELKSRVEEIYLTVPNGYKLHLVTSGIGISQESKEKLDTFKDGLGGPTKDFFVWELEDLKFLQDSFYTKNLPAVEQPIVFELDKQPPYQVRAADHDCYVFHLPGSTLARLYEDLGESLLQQNIRVYEGDKGTNASIRQTCVGEQSANFFHFNNGVTFLCESAQWDQFISKITLKRAQVVNGGQTIRIIYRTFHDKNLKEDIQVPVRVITSKGDKEFANDVAVNLNNQNRIDSAFLRSNNPRIVQLANSLASTGWFLERREDELLGLTNQEKEEIVQRIGHDLEGRVIKLKEGAQAYVTTFYRQPELAKKNAKKIFLGPKDGGHFEKIFDENMSAENFALAYRIKNRIDYFTKQFLTRKRRKTKVADWRSDYKEVLSEEIVDDYGEELDQVIPQSAVFLCAIIFEEQVRVLGSNPENLLVMLNQEGEKILVGGLRTILKFAKDNPNNPQIANKNWPNLLKSQTFFENVASFIKGRASNSP